MSSIEPTFMINIFLIIALLLLFTAITKEFADRKKNEIKIKKVCLDEKGNLIRIDNLKDKELYTLYNELTEKSKTVKTSDVLDSLEQVKFEMKLRHLPYI